MTDESSSRDLFLSGFLFSPPGLQSYAWIVPGVLTGGEKRKSEKARIRKGINILVTTPGRLLDHVSHTANITFNRVKWLVLDEADRLTDMGYEKDVAKWVFHGSMSIADHTDDVSPLS